MSGIATQPSRRFAALAALSLALAACGGGGAFPSAATTTSPATTLPGDTTTLAVTSTTAGPTPAAATTTTVDALPGTFADFLSAPVEDPFYGTGYRQMEWADETHGRLISAAPLTGTERLALAALEPLPATAGLSPDQRLVMVWLEGYSGTGMPPFGVALYRPGVSGWALDVVIRTSDLLGFLETTTDYQAQQPPGPALLHMLLTSFEWSGFARIRADVTVYDDAAATHAVYEGEVECQYSDPGGCSLLSDDGVLRPGDVGEAVQAFEEDLEAVGYFPGTPDTIYDLDTETAVELFQRDYRLAVDGKAGPQTLALAEDLRSGAADIVMAFAEGVDGVSFGALVESALPALIARLGSPDYTVGWEPGPCDTGHWYHVTWGGFTAVFTESNGSRQFDGWEVTDLAAVPPNLYFVGGIAPGWTWSDLAAMGAQYDPFYGWWYHPGFEYRKGTFVNPPSDPPAPGAKVLGFGTGTGGMLWDC